MHHLGHETKLDTETAPILVEAGQRVDQCTRRRLEGETLQALSDSDQESAVAATGRTRLTSHPSPGVISLLAVIVTAIVLRPAATSIGPLLAELKADLGMSDTVAGLLTALPGLSFAFIGLTANRLAPKLGLVGSLIQAALFITLGSAIRVLTGSWELFLGFSLIALAGMAIGNVLLPAFIKVAYPNSATAMSTVYTTFLALGAILPTILDRPLEEVGSSWLGSDRGWRLGVGIWALLGLAALILWLGVHFRANLPEAATSYGSGQRFHVRQLWRSPTAVALMVFFGIQSMQAYIQFGWLAQMYRDGGLGATDSALMVSIVAAGGVPGGLLMPRIVARQKGLRWWIVLFAVLLAVGYLGVAFLPTTTPWIWAVSLGISGFAFSAALAMIISRTRSSSVTGGVSAFVQPFGYFLAALGPFLTGWAYEAVGSWTPILVTLAATSLVMAGAGLLAARPCLIDDELPTSGKGAS